MSGAVRNLSERVRLKRLWRERKANMWTVVYANVTLSLLAARLLVVDAYPVVYAGVLFCALPALCLGIWGVFEARAVLRDLGTNRLAADPTGTQRASRMAAEPRDDAKTVAIRGGA